MNGSYENRIKPELGIGVNAFTWNYVSSDWKFSIIGFGPNGRYYFKKENDGPFVGGGLSLISYSWSGLGQTGSGTITSLGGEGGYQWRWENFFNEAIKLYEKEKYEDARFLFERNIVFNPKDANSYLYLAKIYNHEEDQRKEEYNLETTLLIDPQNEEAILMLMKIALEKSNYDKVKELSETFVQVCKSLCDENNEILDSLKNLEPSNES